MKWLIYMDLAIVKGAGLTVLEDQCLTPVKTGAQAGEWTRGCQYFPMETCFIHATGLPF